MVKPHRRTLTVLAALVGGMTLASAVLLLLEPRPVTPGSQVTTLRELTGEETASPLFEVAQAAPNRWRAIVIHHSGTRDGSAVAINRVHERLNLGGLGYHFVITNGAGGPDGQIEVGYRWRHQHNGAHSAGRDADWYNRWAIGICLIGDPQDQPPTQRQVDHLVWLVRELQARYRIPSTRVLVQPPPSQPAGRLFPDAAFRQQLLAVTAP